MRLPMQFMAAKGTGYSVYGGNSAPPSESGIANVFDLCIIVPRTKSPGPPGPVVTRIRESVARANLRAQILLIGEERRIGMTPTAETDAGGQEDAGHEETCPIRICGSLLDAVRTAAGNVVIVIDADECQVAGKIPDLARAVADRGVEIVVGGRYESACRPIAAGRLSRMSAGAASILAGLNGDIRDPLSGVYAIRRDVIPPLPLFPEKEMRTALDWIVACQLQHVSEIPMWTNGTAVERPPKARRRTFNEFGSLKRALERRFGHAAYFVQFGLVGSSGMVVDLGMLAILLKWTPYPLARAVAIWIAMSWNFTLNRNVTFSYARSRPILPQYIGYCTSCLLGAGVNWSTSVSLATFNPLFRFHPVLAGIAGVAAGMMFNYFLCHRFVFRKQC